MKLFIQTSSRFGFGKLFKSCFTVELDSEIINVEDSLSRILYEDIIIKNDLPSVDKALIDGYAVNSRDIAEADANNPLTLKIIGEANLGDPNTFTVSENETVKVSKGAVMPENTDAVVMPEDTLTKAKKYRFLQMLLPVFRSQKKLKTLEQAMFLF